MSGYVETPGYIREMLGLAKAAGLKAWLQERDEDDDGEDIVCKIRGTQDQLRAAQFVSRKFKFPVHGASIDSRPFAGSLDRVEQSDTFTLTTRWTAPTEVSRDPHAKVERITYPAIRRYDEGLVHRAGFGGLPPDVERSVGLRAGKLSRMKPPRVSKSGSRCGSGWSCIHFPSGGVLYQTEKSERAAAEICAVQQARGEALLLLAARVDGKFQTMLRQVMFSRNKRIGPV